MHALPTALVTARQAVLSQHPAAELDRASRALSDRYLADRPAPAPIMTSRLRAAAYVLTRMPATFAASRAALAEVAAAVPSLRPLAASDLGAGTGAMSWAALDTFDTLTSLTLTDYASEALELAAGMLAHAPVRVHSRVGRLDAPARPTDTTDGADPAGSADPDAAPAADRRLALAGYVLGEMAQQGQDAVVDRLVSWADTVVVVEPGTPAGYARLMRVRERLLAAGLQIAAPCPHEEPCPLRPGDWCHAAARLERTSAHRQAKGGSRGFEDEKFAYVAATRLPVERPPARVLRHPQVRSGHVRLQLCESDGQEQVRTVTRRDKQAFRAARKAAWGDRWDEEPTRD
ncbi:small ribosomal subunit Rsm22 family protein [Ruania suaedae]|uniref:small ribosomal subunit Rsm22 family protein n=1 Tax=Ruania suaedae TaxID=2897774 RepID=UPI001E42C697|nr:small ribosomal subunit Rsm22 family protein [Ruania suaedae]UFU02801.1 small ribosomal subunit Rsm22 family protein [Ruania suaedae]